MSPEIVDVDAKSVYHKNYPEFPEFFDDKAIGLEEIKNGSWDMGNLYILADRCDVPMLRRAIVDRLHLVAKLDKDAQNYGYRTKTAETTTLCSYAGAIHALRNHLTTLPLCRLLVDIYVDFYARVDDEKCSTEKLLRQRYRWNLSFQSYAI
jgi:hypothetical protein